MKQKLPYRIGFTYRMGVFVFLALIVGLELGYYFNIHKEATEVEIVAVPKDLMEVKNGFENKEFQENSTYYSTYSKKVDNYVKFNPNHYTLEDWKQLGLSEKQALSILKYKNNYLKGTFSSKEEIQNCFVISDEKFEALKPFILLPEKSTKKWKKEFPKFEKNKDATFEKKKITYQKFNPNNYTLTDWKRIGFSEKQAQTILNYKTQFLKGSFTQVEELQKCFVISDEKYAEMKPYIFLPEKSERVNEERRETLQAEKQMVAKNERQSEEKREPTKPKKDLKPFNINDLDENGFLELGFTRKQIVTIFKYKKSCGGKFTSLAQFKKCYVVSEEKFEELKEYIRFE